MDIESHYHNILESIKKGHRGLVRFSVTELHELQKKLAAASAQKEYLQMEKILCLIEHSAVPSDTFEEILIQVMNPELPDHLTIFALNCSRKHIILARVQRGQRLPLNFLESLKKNLQSRSPEVVEWALRTIEECGNQGVYFLKEFDKIKPPPWKWFNPHQRAVREIITLLERRWSHLEISNRS